MDSETRPRSTHKLSLHRSPCAYQVGLIIALRGALLASLVCFTMPAVIFLHSARGRASSGLVRAVHKALAGYGVAMAGLGTACVLSAR